MAILTRNDIRGVIAEFKKDQKAALQAFTKRARLAFRVYQKLLLAGCDMSEMMLYDVARANFRMAKPNDLCHVRRLVGKWYCRPAEVVSASQRKIRISVQPTDNRFYGFQFSYISILPENARCRIEKVTQIYTDDRLVCSK